MEGIVAVLFLGAKSCRGDDDHASFGKPFAGQLLSTLANRTWEAAGVTHIETQLHGGRYLIDVLAAGPRGTDERLFNIAWIDLDLISNPEHKSVSLFRRPTCKLLQTHVVTNLDEGAFCIHDLSAEMLLGKTC